MKLTSISEIKKIIERHGFTFNKGYGQNFLTSEAVPRRIADACGAGPGDGVFEIGPGIGTLTAELSERCGRVLAVEIDARLIPVLGEPLSDRGNVKVLNADVMKLDLKRVVPEEFPGMRVFVCANLPYYITTPVIMLLIESGAPISGITVMVQKEVADRLCSAPGDPEYGAVTASVARFGTVSRLFTVPAGCFMPAPKVDSAVIKITPYEKKPYSVADEKTLSRVIRGAFAQRRKTLLNSLGSEFTELEKDEISRAIADAGLAPGVRGERLGIKEFAAIADGIFTREEKR